MKQLIISTLIALIGLSSCYEDESTLGTNNISDITIEGLTDQSVISYIGNKIEIQPNIKTEYPENELQYAWYLYKESGGEVENGYKNQLISNEKNLSYEVNLPSGTYNIVLEVKSLSNNYTKTSTMKIFVSTDFSKGFYILKETADGNTEVDLYNNNRLSSNLMTSIVGSPLKGKPRNISIVYSGEYIDPDKNEAESTNLVHIFTEDNIYKGFRAEDMKEVFNNSTLFYSGEMEPNEEPYTIFRAPNHTVYFSNTGIRNAQTAFGSSGHNTGMLGYPVDAHGTSKFVQPVYRGIYMLYWSNSEHKLRVIDRNFTPSAEVKYDSSTSYPDDLNCICSGINEVGGVQNVIFICESASTKDRYVLLVDPNNSYKIKKCIKLDPSFHISKSNMITVNKQTATYIYCISNNELYAYSWETNDERKFALPGVDSSETISYVTNQYFYYKWDLSTNFNSLIIGTQTGNKYKLYFYNSENMNGGQPISEGTSIEGEGILKSVRFLSSLQISGSDHLTTTPIYPLTD